MVSLPSSELNISSGASPAERGDLPLKTLFTDNRALLKELLDRQSELPVDEIFVPAALANAAAVESLLAADPSWARRIGGPMQTQAVTYAAFGRYLVRDTTYPARQQQIVSLLLANGADPNSFARAELLGNEGDGRLSALYGCCRPPGNPAVAKLLLDAGAKTGDGESVYHAAHSILQADPDLVASLPPRDHGNIATFARGGRVKTVRLMLEAGFDIEARADDLDATPLLYAATTGDLAMVELLLAHGARLDVTHKYGGTPVRSAVYCAAHFNSGRTTYAQTIRRLLEAGDVIGDNSLELAIEHHLDDIVDVLKAHGASL